MKITRAEYAGACYGVERALSLVDKAADGPTPVHTLGPLIHNPQVVAELQERGVEVATSVDEVASGTLVLRSHGVAPQVVEAARAKGLVIVDATCPHVSKAQQAARELREQGSTVFVVGERGHPEVEAISSWAGEGTLVVQEPGDLPPLDGLQPERIGVVVQTTQSPGALAAIVAALEARGIQPEVRDTICFATRQRQEAAIKLAREVEVMIVVGGRNSGNTTRLAELCRTVCPCTWHIESSVELRAEWFAGVEKVGVSAGASTPEAQIVEVEQALANVG
ncbi:MAG: 4-hydroxy-3-methylbut-2-enyl diphosphate reductase [Coriobacteriales bacterium]|jgi:4-hydroxy-3-methylbut-2-enyl diphosphate reductase|nr:4-hydroxy-3-methylbut-2-enyl diphosphate reductase [Coriobacteriales bacterium]